VVDDVTPPPPRSGKVRPVVDDVTPPPPRSGKVRPVVDDVTPLATSSYYLHLSQHNIK